jgi:putative restriction endonuclease
MTAASKPGLERPYGNEIGSDGLGRYLVTETRRRLHQPLFASRVMLAYEVRCAVCALHHRELLDAAHIIADSDPDGWPVVSNALALCKIHHAAYDRNILGIRPDYVVEIHHRLLHELDGPMLRHGRQDHHDQRLMQLPRRRADHPDPDRLMARYAEFRAA